MLLGWWPSLSIWKHRSLGPGVSARDFVATARSLKNCRTWIAKRLGTSVWRGWFHAKMSRVCEVFFMSNFQEPGDSGRDLLIPDRWRSLNLWKGELPVDSFFFFLGGFKWWQSSNMFFDFFLGHSTQMVIFCASTFTDVETLLMEEIRRSPVDMGASWTKRCSIWSQFCGSHSNT